VQKVIWALDELGKDFEVVEVGGVLGQTNDAWYVALNPNSLIPTIDDDGFILWESHAILRYLARMNDSNILLPSDPRKIALVDQWLDWVAQSINPEMKPVFLGLVRVSPEKRDYDGIENAKRSLEQRWAVLDRHLEGKSYLLGDAFTIADIAIAIQADRWFRLVADHSRLPNVERWMELIRNRPAFQAHIAGPIH
jgi:glutathione S-transferase